MCVVPMESISPFLTLLGKEQGHLFSTPFFQKLLVLRCKAVTEVDGINYATSASCDSVCKPGGNKLMTDL